MKRPNIKMRGKGIYIVTAVVALLICLAWFFFLLSPTREDIAQRDEEIGLLDTDINAANQQIARLQSYKKTAPQSRSEIVRLGKMLPESEGIPSLIVELTKTASTSGVTISAITRGDTSLGTPFGIQTVSLVVAGRFFDVEDFLHRTEAYVDMHNENFRVTGRLLQVTNLTLVTGAASTSSSSTASPMLTVNIDINAYLWGGTSTTTASSTSTSGGGS
ncbi:MAG: type 4a pilus biogenesis protein PilO [Thermoleophilia bacterium]